MGSANAANRFVHVVGANLPGGKCQVHVAGSDCMGDASPAGGVRSAPRPCGVGTAAAFRRCPGCCLALPRVFFTEAAFGFGMATFAPAAPVAASAAACASTRRIAWRSMTHCTVCVVKKSGSALVSERAN